MGLFDGRREETPEWRNPDPKIRRVGVTRLEDPRLLSELTHSDSDEEVRRKALETLEALALTDDAEKALAAVQLFSDEARLTVVARQSPREEVARAAMGKLRTGRALVAVARHGKHLALRMEAVALLSEPEDLGQIALKTEEKAVALAALERIAALVEEKGLHEVSVAEVLGSIAERARNKVVARRARALMRGGEAPAAPKEGKPETDRPRQRELCESMEELTAAVEVDGLQERIDRLRGDWIDLVPRVDDDLEERFEAAWRSAKEHCNQRGREQAEQRSREAEAAMMHSERVAPRLDLIQRVESFQGEEAEIALSEARREWEFLRVLDTEEGETLLRRFEEACASCETRLEAWKGEKNAALARERKDAQRKEKERQEKENLRHREQICVRSERLLSSETTSLKAAARSLKEIRLALQSPGPFPSVKDRKTLLARMSALQAALGPRLIELRRSEAWKHWANEEVQEDLCRRAEKLAEEADPVEAGHRLTDLQARWRQASAVSREKSQELWQRFKLARDAIRTRMDAHQREQADRKESLCRQAEELASSSAWVSTTEALKRLQAEWKTLVSGGRAKDRALWERFRAACDQFFTRRKQDLKQRRQDWALHLKTRMSLCEQAEAHSSSSDWEAAASALKKLQAEWKGIGPVSRKDSEVTWHRFRAACDAFFERYKRRHEIEREARVERQEKMCADLESLLSAQPPAPVEGLPEKLRSVQAEWAACGSTPPRAERALETRYQSALDRVIVAFPEALKDSEFDALRNRKMMEELLARVEKLATERNRADSSALSPATRLATLWVEAMAANTIGGSLGSQAETRAAQEEVRKAQIAWQKIGHVPREMRGDLPERFQRACGAILQEGQERTEPSSPGLHPHRPR